MSRTITPGGRGGRASGGSGGGGDRAWSADEGGPAPAVYPLADDVGGAGERESEALSDLFLGPSVGTRAGASASMGGAGAVGAGPEASNSGPLAFPRLVNDGAPNADGERVGRDSADRASTGRDGGDAAGRARGAGVELVILSHLPGLGAAWLTQYAAWRAAEAGGPVGLVRVRTDETSVTLVERRGGFMPAGANLASGAGYATLERAAEGAGAVAWLVHADEDASGDLASRADSVTLLSGTDEIAVVGCYRALKALGVRPGAVLRVALVGATGERGREAAERLRRAAASFLGREVEVVLCAGKIGPTPSVMVYRGPGAGDAEALLRTLRRGPGAEARTGATAPAAGAAVGAGAATTPAPQRTATSAWAAGTTVQHETREMGVRESVVREPVMREPTLREPSLREPVMREPLLREPVMHEPVLREIGHATPTPSTGAAPAARGSSLAGLVGGLRTLDLRCPFAPGVELAADRDERLHLLAECRGAGDEAVRDLLSVEAWAATHGALLRRALGVAVGSEGRERPTMHVLTETPRSLRRMLDCPVRVHALVRAGGAVGAVELN